MDVKRAQFFLRIAKLGSVTAAAAELGITQPALSRQLRRFEAELGLGLVERGGSALRLSEAGKALVPVCRRLVAEHGRAARAAGELRRGEPKVLQVAATATTISTILAPFIAQAGPAIPLVATRAAAHYEIYDALDAGADCVISPLPPRADLATRSLGVARIRAWMHPAHRLAKAGDRVQAGDLAGEVVALPTPKSVSRALVDAFFAAAGTAPGRDALTVECEDTATLIALARGRRAVALCTELAVPGLVGAEVAAGGRALGGVPLHVAWRGEHFARAEIAALAGALAAYVARQGLGAGGSPGGGAGVGGADACLDVGA